VRIPPDAPWSPGDVFVCLRVGSEIRFYKRGQAEPLRSVLVVTVPFDIAGMYPVVATREVGVRVTLVPLTGTEISLSVGARERVGLGARTAES